MIPPWMRDKDAGKCPRELVLSGRKSFVRKTIDEIFEFFQASFETESFSKRPGLLQSLDPRAKLVCILALVFALSLTRDLRILLAIYLLELLLSYASMIEVFFFIKRVWLFIPLFTGVIAIPIIFNVFLPGDMLYPVIYLGAGAHIGPLSLPESIYITKQGTHAAVIFTLRVAVSVSAVVLLFLSTQQQVLFKSLRSVGVPKLYVLTLEMAYRYIFLLIELIREMHIAKKARTIRSQSTVQEQKWVGGRIGYVLIRSLSMSEQVHMAMLSRGFEGEARTFYEFRMHGRDWMAVAFSLSISLLLILASQNMIRI